MDYSLTIIDYTSKNYNVYHFPTTFKIYKLLFKYFPITFKNYKLQHHQNLSSGFTNTPLLVTISPFLMMIKNPLLKATQFYLQYIQTKNSHRVSSTCSIFISPLNKFLLPLFDHKQKE